jgi:hypothetical protein
MTALAPLEGTGNPLLIGHGRQFYPAETWFRYPDEPSLARRFAGGSYPTFIYFARFLT